MDSTPLYGFPRGRRGGETACLMENLANNIIVTSSGVLQVTVVPL